MTQPTIFNEFLKNSNLREYRNVGLDHGPGNGPAYGPPYGELLFDHRHVLDRQGLFFNLVCFAAFIKLTTATT